MRSMIQICLFLIATTQLQAQVPVVIDLPGSGRYVIEVTIDSNGKVIVVQLPIHQLKDGNPNPIIPRDPDDPIPDLSEAAKTVKNLTAALDVEPELIEAIKIMYGTVGDSIRDGSIDVKNANKSLSTATNAIGRRGGLKVRRALEPWREGVSDVLLDFASAGEYDTQDEIANALEEIVVGIQAHQDSSGLFKRLDPEKLERWLEFILKIIKLFMMFVDIDYRTGTALV